MSTTSTNEMTEAQKLRKKKEIMFFGVALALTGLIVIDVALFDVFDAAFGPKIARAVAVFFGVMLVGCFIIKWGLNLMNKSTE